MINRQHISCQYHDS